MTQQSETPFDVESEFHLPPPPPLSDEERRLGLEALERAQDLSDRFLKDNGGKLFPSSWIDIRAERDAREAPSVRTCTP